MRPKEEKFEDHFCKKLGDHDYRKRKTENVDLKFNIDDDLLQEFLEKTQPDELKELKGNYGDKWLSEIKKEVLEQLKSKKLFEVLKDGAKVNNQLIKLIYFKPETSYNKEQKEKYKSNIFSYVRQFRFRDTQESIDIVLFLNGLALITIELKSPFNGQVVEDAVVQYINDRDKSLNIFRKPILHIAADTKKAKVTTEFLTNTVEDFVWFNKELENPEVEGEYHTEYLYNEILLPDSLIEIIEHYLHSFELKLPNGKRFNTFFFPRYHQRRTIIKLVEHISKKYKNDKILDLKYLIQHSAGSGKSFTISVIQKFLRYLHVDDQPVFDSTIILTDRINLDSQLRGTISSSESQENIIDYVETTKELAKALNKNTKVIVTTIQKFSVTKLNEILEDQKNKKICFIIDEAHRSQSGKLHKNMVGHFEPEEENIQEEIIVGIAKKKFPNFVFIALTATPSDKAITMFGRPFDVYSMDQAEKENYIINVSENIVSYETLFKLSHNIESYSEYPPLIIAKKLKNKAYEDDKVIKNKIDIILKIFENHTKYAIKDNYAKSMIVTSSRKAAVKYQLIINQILKERKLNYKTLVAFTGNVQLEKEGVKYTESNLNKIKEEIKEEFKKPEYRFLIVANKFQTGFNQPLLHTMFLDKSVADINAVQTISRLNRIFPKKNDSLVVDFTGSYKKIIKAFSKFKDEVNDYSGLNVKELPRLYNEALTTNLFTKKDIQDFKEISIADKDPINLIKIASKIEKALKEKKNVEERRAFRSLLKKYNDTFNYLSNLVSILDQELKDYALFSYYMFNYLNPEGKSRMLDEELKKVYLKMHQVKLKKSETMIVKESSASYGKKKAIRYATIKEVVEAINTKFDMALTDNNKGIIDEYMEEIIKDDEIKTDII
jgi:type I restriction enzyme, R subunit